MQRYLLMLVLVVMPLLGVQKVFAQSTDMMLANEYYSNGEYQKAISLYSKLAKNDQHIFEIHRNYLESMLKLEMFDDADKYLRKQLRNYPMECIFNVDYGILLTLQGKKEEAEKVYEAYIVKIKKDDNLIRTASRYFMNANLFDYAEKLYLAGRKNGNDRFTYELATLYSVAGKTEMMINEYLELINEGSDQGDYVQNILQSRIRDDEDFAKLEEILYKFIQKYPEQVAYSEMLVWYFIQRKEFSKAFMQAKAIDKRRKLEGTGLFDLGELSLENKDYAAGIKIFEYIVDKYKNQPIYADARRLLVKSKEELIKNTFPVDYAKIRSLVSDYRHIIDELGWGQRTADAARSMALLHAFYLNNKDTAIAILEKAVTTPGMKKEFIDLAKLDLGDIYLLKGENWEATLLYSQVEKAEKDRNLGHIAKLKNARLNYYKGNFELAKEHLDVLKLATSREIANDAMQLSLLIGDNLALDTSAAPLTEFASIDLLVFQSQYEKALTAYDVMLKKYPGHSLTDEVFWAKANILLKMGKFEETIGNLEKILEEFPDDILADDANYLIGKIYDDNLNNKEKAMEYFKNQLIKYPGSIYNVEARKRFRALRGDGIN